MLGGVLLVGEPASGLDHDLRAERSPVQLGRILDGKNLDALSADDDRIAIRFHFFVQPAEDRIVFQKMRQRLRISKIVGGDKFDIGMIQAGTDHIASDAAEAVDAYFNGIYLSVYKFLVSGF